MKKMLFETIRKSENKTRICMYDECTLPAIKSHVLQKNGILRQIAEDNHLIQQSIPNPFYSDTKGIMDFKSVGVNNVYTFSGFCKKHDDEVFKPIESIPDLEFNSPDRQALFCYRGLCQEIRRKEIAIEWIKDIRKQVTNEATEMMGYLSDGYIGGLKNLNYFKIELEKSIKSNNYEKFHFETITIPRIELCISVPLNIGELEIPEDGDYDKWNANLEFPAPTSFINVFPRDKDSVVICGYHKDFPCPWTIDFIKQMKTGDRKLIFKALSDLITMRLEFWVMSQSLFDNIEADKIEEYKKLFTENVYDHSPELETSLNLFGSL